MRAYLLTVLLVCLFLLNPLATQATTSTTRGEGAPVFFSETGHTLAYSFRQFYEGHGGAVVFGFPLTEVYLEESRPVQYFERARLEWHAESLTVQVGHLGRWAAQGREELPAFQWTTQAYGSAGALYFPQSGHTLRAPFLPFWEQYGGVATFGYPISEPFDEQETSDAPLRTVQYFERARLELPPQPAGDNQVQVSELGRRYLAAHPAPQWAMQPVDAPAQAWDGVRPVRVMLPRIGVDTAVVETGFSADTWDVPRYSAAHYWGVSAYPGTGGNTIIAGHVGYSGIIFHTLPSVQNGDVVLVTAGGQEHRYIVREVLTLLPQDTWVLEPTDTETLTLITCIPIGVYSHRLVVRATPS
jgi:LPXTG-site transpeptidase (sortase) family protein